MGTYVYKVTSKKVALTDGTFANVAVFAYKPYFWDDALNARMAFKTGCAAADRFVNGKNFTGKIVLGHKDEETGKIEANENAVAFKYTKSYGSFEDYLTEKMEKVGFAA